MTINAAMPAVPQNMSYSGTAAATDNSTASDFSGALGNMMNAKGTVATQNTAAGESEMTAVQQETATGEVVMTAEQTMAINQLHKELMMKNAGYANSELIAMLLKGSDVELTQLMDFGGEMPEGIVAQTETVSAVTEGVVTEQLLPETNTLSEDTENVQTDFAQFIPDVAEKTVNMTETAEIPVQTADTEPSDKADTEITAAEDTVKLTFATATEEILPADLTSALDAHPAVTTVVITSPTYHGVISDIAALADVCHARNVTLIVDEAHGAHLGFAFGESSIRLGADIVIQSLHKTLPALTQTAILHCKERFAAAMARENAVFETSSPSYILMASADECFAFLSSENGRQAMEAYKENLLSVREKLQKSLQNFRLLESPRYDMGKLVILTHGTDCTGRQLADTLRKDYRIETEMSLPHSLTAMTSPCDTEKELNAFADAVLEIDKTVHTAQTPVLPAASLPKQVYPTYAVYGKEGVCLPIEEAVGKISLSYLWAYPPGIPLLTPGERVDETVLEAVKQYERAGIPLHGMEKGLACISK